MTFAEVTRNVENEDNGSWKEWRIFIKKELGRIADGYVKINDTLNETCSGIKVMQSDIRRIEETGTKTLRDHLKEYEETVKPNIRSIEQFQSTIRKLAYGVGIAILIAVLQFGIYLYKIH